MNEVGNGPGGPAIHHLTYTHGGLLRKPLCLEHNLKTMESLGGPGVRTWHFHYLGLGSFFLSKKEKKTTE